MEININQSKLYETMVTTDYATAHLVMQMHKDATLIHYNEAGHTIAYHISWRKGGKV